MDWSLGEVRALAVKATRGAGFSWGLAEEAGHAVIWLQIRNAPGVQALANYLDTDPIAFVPDAECPLRLGTALVDRACPVPTEIFDLRQPLLLLPFLLAADDAGVGILTVGETPELSVSHKGIGAGAERLLLQTAKIRWQPDGAQIEGDCQTRVPVTAKDAIKRLGIHAHKTYAPATEASRLAGAGAGLNDND